MSDGCEFIFELSLGGEIFELIDEVLEPIIRSSVFVFSRFLDELGQVASGSYFGIKGVKVFIIVLYKFCEGLVFRFK